MQCLKKQLFKIWKSEDGTYTLEATLIFPLIMFLTLLFLLVAVVQWQQAALNQNATIIAEQLAANWDVSAKEITTGNFALINNDFKDTRGDDGLYWRIFNDGAATSQEPASFFNGLSKEKIDVAMEYLHDKGVSGTISYSGLPARTITVKLNRDVFPKLHLPFLNSSISATSTAHVAEPVQFMRNIDMAIYYSKSIEENFKIFESFNKKKKK
ncbi:hypothetical protein DP73_03795 [Desulfosporosinus sp. HMP52]|uniref:TadE/TadG family type IV pilus assembly protein n=1 Tax=Desulfosporosinus sp. HMP52 TaxID=1487923 RepID=UPI00051FC511|nr:hypothetical protein [Desulfosporosinus sp. HMP52]KGK91398.1 hypothetical protein DP73_03795 [Desulfosporosinus sp. HMP52]